ncbi:ribonuclease H1 large subunit, putative [Theileria equi strain WA]|uniref:Ribonuclease n=1 Tax=Theileria equi strain WA TaxID=1537102 RepID=L0AZX3_THEEQ|nr:ribonuclease H1 large subunit, putative [Theileria equi strain WA]AFZ80551.1 ribonuclease H1 large subunit, putative [Theileria equi strain WA]|eukprot:XP_004830217.1 ribonuclease H1 large subunit, putative [Theileria equi strain WA]
MEDYQNLKCFRLYKSSLPSKETPVALGIDEAGRGPVLGAMVFGGFFCPIGAESEAILKGDIKVDDSKKLNELAREYKFRQLHDETLPFGLIADVVTPQYISYKMLQRTKYNLNEMSHDTEISIIRHVISAGYNLKEIYVDTVGVESKYEAKLKNLFPNIHIKVAKKADSLFPVVSAASIVAKVVRDNIIKCWSNSYGTSNIGSGYPGDAYTIRFLSENLHKIFGFPDIVRFSWRTASDMLNDQKRSAIFNWYDDLEEENDELSKKTVKKNLGNLPKSLALTITNKIKL